MAQQLTALGAVQRFLVLFPDHICAVRPVGGILHPALASVCTSQRHMQANTHITKIKMKGKTWKVEWVLYNDVTLLRQHPGLVKMNSFCSYMEAAVTFLWASLLSWLVPRTNYLITDIHCWKMSTVLINRWPFLDVFCICAFLSFIFVRIVTLMCLGLDHKSWLTNSVGSKAIHSLSVISLWGICLTPFSIQEIWCCIL